MISLSLISIYGSMLSHLRNCIYGFGPRRPVSHVLGTPTSPKRLILAYDFMSNEDVNNLKSKLASAGNSIEENNERIDNLTVRLERVERNLRGRVARNSAKYA
ncbi:Uncharacterized protein Adt_41343 [Abeliophyllum distichum]|uniref:Uncharacterized protein n=1 Tax=Abeliophyllum distichum TaxID=126358 RepID=A0ABD1PNL0_9LAMI